MKELEIAKSLAIEAGKRILEIYKSKDLDVQHKEDNSPLTRADKEANEIIVSKLRSEFPYTILTEEEKDNKSRINEDYVWIIDPLDGTKEFISGRGEFTVNIALVKDRKPILGVIYVPVKEELYYSSEKGAFFEKDGRVGELKVSEKNNIGNMILVMSRSHAGEKENRVRTAFKEAISAGSSLKGCLVASGKADTYIRFGPVNEWDICAMNAIVNGAGGIMTDLEGKELVYNKEDTLVNGFIASNNKIHDELLKLANDE